MGSASSSASTGIESPGGSINENSQSTVIVAIVVVALVLFLFLRRKK